MDSLNLKGGGAVSPGVWGASGWALLHRMSFCFASDSDSNTNANATHALHADFFRTLELVLPCPKCRRNMADHFQKLPFPRKASDVPLWTWKLHKRVSESLSPPKPPSHSPPFAEVRQVYSNSNPCEPKECETIFLMAIAESHPGSRGASDTYVAALETFMRVYLENSHSHANAHTNPPTKKQLQSRSAFRTYLQKLLNLKTKKRIQFDKCT